MPVEIPDTPHGHAAGPYSPLVRCGDWLVLAGQVGIDPSTGGLAEGGVEAETRQIFANVEALLGDVGASLTDIAKTTVFLADIDEWSAMNDGYEDGLHGHKPARTAIQAGALPVGARVEIEVWAHKPSS